MRCLRSSYGKILQLLVITAAVVSCSGTSEKPGNSGIKAPLLIITLDTTRADRLGCYGSKGKLTPFLDEFSKEAFLFDRCDTPVPLTLPAHVSIFSGFYPQHTGIQTNTGGEVPERLPLMAEEFSRSGYSTSAFISSPILHERYGLDRGFDLYDQSFYVPRLGMAQRASAKDTLAKAGSWIAEKRASFFCWVHLFDPHYPYNPPEPWATELKGSPYDGAIASMDAALAGFFASSAMKEWREWYVVICADHGESLGDHGESRHGILIYEPVMRVPLLIHVPRQRSPGRIHEWVSLVDVLPTIRDFNGMPPATCDGVSLRPLFEGGAIPSRPIFMGSQGGMMSFGWAPLFGAIVDGMKYIQAPLPECYDISDSSAESDNLAGKNRGAEESIRSALKDYILTRPMAPAKAPGGLSGEEFEQLAGLGYIESGFSGNSQYRKDPKALIGLVDGFQKAEELLKKGDRAGVRTVLKEIQEKDPDNPYLFFMKGKVAERDSLKEASDAYGRSAKLNPSNYLVWSMWIRLHLNEGNIREAAVIARKALEACPDRMGYFNIALAEEALFEGRDAAKAKMYIDRALNFSPDLARAHMVLFELALRERNKAGAEEGMMNVWKYGTQAEVDSWRKDPLFRNFFEAAPSDDGNTHSSQGTDLHGAGDF